MSLNNIIKKLDNAVRELDSLNELKKAAYYKAKSDAQDQEIKALKAQLKTVEKSRDAFKGLYEKKNKYSLRLEHENSDLVKKNGYLASLAETQLEITGTANLLEIDISHVKP